MKHIAYTLLFVLLLAFMGNAQSIGVFGGLTNSAFEGQGEAASGIEAGAAFVLDALPILEAGVEFSMSVSPFEFEATYGGTKFTQKNKQTMFGAFVKYNISLPALTPYIRGGVGYYSGSTETNLPQQIKDLANLDGDYKSTLGFNIGAGVDTFIGLNAEFIYHLVSQKLDVEGAKSAGANYWGIRVGYTMSLL